MRVGVMRTITHFHLFDSLLAYISASSRDNLFSKMAIRLGMMSS